MILAGSHKKVWVLFSRQQETLCRSRDLRQVRRDAEQQTRGRFIRRHSDQENDPKLFDIDVFHDTDDGHGIPSDDSNSCQTTFLKNAIHTFASFKIDREAILSIQTHIPAIRYRLAWKLKVNEKHASFYDPAEVFYRGLPFMQNNEGPDWNMQRGAQISKAVTSNWSRNSPDY